MAANTGVGVAWQSPGGERKRLGELAGPNLKSTVSDVVQIPARVSFAVSYDGDFSGVSRIVERHVVTPKGVELTTEIPGYTGPLRYLWPILSDDGRTKSEITPTGGVVWVSQDGGKTAQIFTATGAQSVRVETERYANHNGWSRLAVAQYPQGGEITLVIAPKIAP